MTISIKTKPRFYLAKQDILRTIRETISIEICSLNLQFSKHIFLICYKNNDSIFDLLKHLNRLFVEDTFH